MCLVEIEKVAKVCLRLCVCSVSILAASKMYLLTLYNLK